MIIKAQKYLILGAKKDLNAFYERAQKEGFIEFIKMSKMQETVPEIIHTYLSAIKILKSYEPLKPISLEKKDAMTAALRVIELKEEIERFEEEERLTAFEMARVAPFGSFSLEDVAFIEKQGHRKMQFFCAKEGKADAILLAHPTLIHLKKAYDLEYFVSLNPTLISYPGLIEVRIDRSLEELLGHKSFLMESIQSMRLELKRFAGALETFREILIEELDAHHLQSAKKEVYSPLEGSSLFSVEAFIPDSKTKELEALIQGLAIYFEPIQIEKEDSVPTILENKGMSRLGEDLVKVYDCPATTDKDPSGWVFWFFALFFAIIVADGGYGLVYLALAGYLKWKFRTFAGSAKRIFRLFVYLSCFVVVWGALTTSFFGLSISQDSILRKMSPVQWIVEKKADYHVEHKDGTYKDFEQKFPAVASVQNGKEFLSATIPPGQNKSAAGEDFGNNFLLEFSLILGIVHISCSLLRYSRRNFAGIGWILFLIGGYLFAPSVLGATSLLTILGDFNKLAMDFLSK